MTWRGLTTSTLLPHWRAAGPPLPGHKGEVSSIAFSPNGKLMATGGTDGAIILWDMPSRQPIGPPFVGSGSVWSLAFRPDGRALAVVGEDRLLMWSVGEEAWREAACRLANRNLTLQEWKGSFGSTPYRVTCPGL